MTAPGQRRARVVLRPTAALGYLTFFLVCIYGGGVHYQSNAAYLVLALGASCAVVSALHARRNLEGLAVSAPPPPPAYSGEALLGAVALRSAALEAVALSFELPEAGSAALATVDQLASETAVELPFALPPRRRGDYRIARVRIASTYPFGLFRAHTELALSLAWVVYPQPLPPGGGEEPPEQPEAASARALSGAGDFRGHRAWATVDPQRHVDWRAAARGGTLLVKQYGDAEPSRELRWEETASSDREERLSRLAGRVLAAEQAGVAYALILPERTISAAHGPVHFHDCMGALARLPG